MRTLRAHGANSSCENFARALIQPICTACRLPYYVWSQVDGKCFQRRREWMRKSV